jgi:hypothetical protein
MQIGMPMTFDFFESPHDKESKPKIKQPCGDKRFKGNKTSGVNNFGGAE